MRSFLILFLLIWTWPAAAAPQTPASPLDLSRLDSLASLAEETVTITLDPSTMTLAKAFLSGQEAVEEEVALNLISGLESLRVRVFEFAEEGLYAPTDLSPIYDQLNGEDWHQIISVNDEERVGVWMFQAADALGGMAVVVEEDNELVVVNIVGTVNVQDLLALGSRFGFQFLPEAAGPAAGGAPLVEEAN